MFGRKDAKPRTLRVRAFTGSDFSGHQLLQEQRWWGWKTIDREEVPAHARISAGATGDPGWTSKFARLGGFGRDGIIVPRGARPRPLRPLTD